jgi:hypothetical protein
MCGHSIIIEFLNDKNMNRKYGALSSSDDPSKLAKTVEGMIISFSALIIYGAAWAGFPLVGDQVSAFASQVGLAVGSIMFLFGVVRKIVVHFAEKKV